MPLSFNNDIDSQRIKKIDRSIYLLRKNSEKIKRGVWNKKARKAVWHLVKDLLLRQKESREC